MKKVLINTNFKDVYTGELYIAGHYTSMTDERIAEVKAVDPNLVTIVGMAESVKGSAPTTPVVGTEAPTNGTEAPVDKALSDMSKKELIDLGKEHGLKLTNFMTKENMIDAIEKAQNPEAETSAPVVGTEAPEGEKPSTEDLLNELDESDEDLEEISL